MVRLRKSPPPSEPSIPSCSRHARLRPRSLNARNPLTSYTQTHALLLHWTDDDIGVAAQLALLSQVLSSVYNFTSILTCSIPSNEPYEFVKLALVRFLEKWGVRDGNSISRQRALLVLYYSGHGEVDGVGGLKWCAFKNPNSGQEVQVPELNWTRLQKSLEHTPSDTLLILDSCASAGSIPFSPQPSISFSPNATETFDGVVFRSRSSTKEDGQASTEILAACGFETQTAGLGPDSFFNLLVGELCCPSLIRREFSVVELHRRILSKAALRGGECRSPLFVRIRGDVRGSSIVLGNKGLSDRRLAGCIKEGKRILGELELKFQKRDDDVTDAMIVVQDVSEDGSEECPQLVDVTSLEASRIRSERMRLLERPDGNPREWCVDADSTKANGLVLR